MRNLITYCHNNTRTYTQVSDQNKFCLKFLCFVAAIFGGHHSFWFVLILKWNISFDLCAVQMIFSSGWRSRSDSVVLQVRQCPALPKSAGWHQDKAIIKYTTLEHICSSLWFNYDLLIILFYYYYRLILRAYRESIVFGDRVTLLFFFPLFDFYSSSWSIFVQ